MTLLLGAAACEPAGGVPSALARRRARAAAFRPPEVAIELQRGTEPRELVRIGTRGVVIGPADGRLEWKFFADPRRADEAWYFLRAYAPFVAKTDAGELSFQGRGKARAGATEQRMILEWTRQVASEAAGGRGGAAYGLVLAWHQGGSSGICSDVVLYRTGEAVATACGWEGEVRNRLDPGPLGRVYGWFDRLQPFQAGSETQEGPNPHVGSLDTRLIFAGRGSRPAKAAEQEEIQSFALSLFSELAARKGGAPPPIPAAPGKPVGKAAPAEAPPSRLLLPPNVATPKPEEITLQLPEKPPPPPPVPGGPTSPPPRGTPG
ncbi:MAG TPA: hypothetical protein VGH73_01600 [Thermoanaerobaculia bacterium]|jgi:hypothetical protein